MELKNLKINLLGDSITEGVGTSSGEHRFGELLAARYGAVVRNYGISGTRIARQHKPTVDNPSFDQHYVSRVAGMEEDADVIVVFGGTNDFGHGDAPLGQMSDREDGTFYGALHCLFITLINKYPAAKIMMLTPMHRWNEDDPRGDNKSTEVGTLETYVNIIREVAQYYSVPVLDLYAGSGITPRVEILKQRYMPDGLHPSDAGNELLCELIANFIRYRL